MPNFEKDVDANDNDDETPSVRRLPVSGVHVSITLGPGSEHMLWADLTLDVTKGGVFVATFHPMPVDTTVHLLLMLEGDPMPIAAEGIVRWTVPHRDHDDSTAGAGIQFTKIEPKSLAALERFANEVREPMMFEIEDPVRRTASIRPRA